MGTMCMYKTMLIYIRDILYINRQSALVFNEHFYGTMSSAQRLVGYQRYYKLQLDLGHAMFMRHGISVFGVSLDNRVYRFWFSGKDRYEFDGHLQWITAEHAKS